MHPRRQGICFNPLPSLRTRDTVSKPLRLRRDPCASFNPLPSLRTRDTHAPGIRLHALRFNPLTSLRTRDTLGSVTAPGASLFQSAPVPKDERYSDDR